VFCNALVYPILDARIHLVHSRERAIAVANDVEVPEVKIGREPYISHIHIMK
jgi:hypothetical protein